MSSGRHGCDIVLQPDGVRIPGYVVDFDSFRRWARSEDFPRRGRIDWIDGLLKVDLSPTRLNSHAAPKIAIAAQLHALVDRRDLGVVFAGRVRMSDASARVSSEPDIAVLYFESVIEGRVKLVRDDTGMDWIEVEGPPDIIVECLGKSSQARDTERLRAAYWAAGVTEYWLVDARGDEPQITMLRRAAEEYAEVAHGPAGFRASQLLGVSVRLVRLPPRAGLVRYRVETRP